MVFIKLVYKLLIAESDSIADSDDPPTTRRIQFYVRNEVGALFNASQVFSVSWWNFYNYYLL